jgi:hypothetical protein
LSFTIKEDGLRAFENKEWGRISGPKKEEETGTWINLQNDELLNSCSSPNIITVFK